MRLLEVEVRHWRGLSQSLGPFSPRLNLVLGPNEAGKSRLFQAIQFALFESHKGAAQHKQWLQSWNSNDSPAVRLAFEVEGRQYELHKQFLKGAMARLVGGGETLRAEDAEAQLRSLLGTRASGSRAPRVEELGIWPLLMVAQGESRRGTGEDLNEDGRGRLQERLSREIGIAAISERGQRLMERVHQEYARYYTATGQETTPLRNARKALAQAQAGLEDAQRVHDAREQTVVEVQEARCELASLSARLEIAQREAAQAEQRAAAAQKAGTQLATAQGVLATALVTVTSAEQELARRREADQGLERLSAETTALDARSEALAVRQRELQIDVEAAAQRVTSAEQAFKAAAAAREQVRREGRRSELTERQRDLAAKVADLERIDRELYEAQQLRAREPDIERNTLAQLQRLQDTARSAEAHLRGAAVSVIVTLTQSLAVDGAVHPAGAQLAFDIVENRTLTLGEVARIEVQPGRGTLDALRDAKSAADADLAEALRRCGVATVQEARAAHERVQQITQQIEQLGGQARATWSKSREQLREALLRTEADLERLGPPMAVAGTEEELQQALESAEAALHEARQARDAANGLLGQARSDGVALNGVRADRRAERERLADDLAGRPAADALARQVEDAVQARGRAQQALEQCKREFDDLGGEEAGRDAKRLAVAHQALLAQVHEVRSRVERLTGALHAASGVGTYDALQDAQANLEFARVQLERLERQAGAARRLWDVLSEERKRVVERLTVPVMQRVKPYLVSLFPGRELDMGEALEMVGLRGENLSEPFEALSGGAQEQLALLTRIGLAEVLAGEGTLPLVLDDSLVNTDPERIRQVHRVLFRAADKLQVLVFSCHDVLFDGLGAEQVFRLSGARRVAV